MTPSHKICFAEPRPEALSLRRMQYAIILGFALAIFLSCTESPHLEFPDFEEANPGSSSDVSSSSAESSSSSLSSGGSSSSSSGGSLGSYCVVDSIETCFSFDTLDRLEYTCDSVGGTIGNCPENYERF